MTSWALIHSPPSSFKRNRSRTAATNTGNKEVKLKQTSGLLIHVLLLNDLSTNDQTAPVAIKRLSKQIGNSAALCPFARVVGNAVSRSVGRRDEDVSKSHEGHSQSRDGEERTASRVDFLSQVNPTRSAGIWTGLRAAVCSLRSGTANWRTGQWTPPDNQIGSAISSQTRGRFSSSHSPPLSRR